MGKRGFTLIEVLIAMTILSIGILGVAGLAGTVIRSSGYSQALTQATNIAQEKLEALVSVDFSNIQATDTATARTDLRRTCTQTDFTASKPVYTCVPTTSTVTVGGKPYTWGYTVSYVDLDASGTASESSDGLKRIDLTVSWTDAVWRTTKSITAVTMRTRG